LIKFRNASPKIFEVLYVSPKEIETFSSRKIDRITQNKNRNRFYDFATVKDGDRDCSEVSRNIRQKFYYVKTFSESNPYIVLEKVFIEGKDFEETEFREQCEREEKDILDEKSTPEKIYYSIKENSLLEHKEFSHKGKCSREYVYDKMINISRNKEYYSWTENIG